MHLRLLGLWGSRQAGGCERERERGRCWREKALLPPLSPLSTHQISHLPSLISRPLSTTNLRLQSTSGWVDRQTTQRGNNNEGVSLFNVSCQRRLPFRSALHSLFRFKNRLMVTLLQKIRSDRRSTILPKNNPSLGPHPHQRPRSLPGRRRHSHRLGTGRSRKGAGGMRAHRRFDPKPKDGGEGVVVGGCSGDW